MLRNVAIFLLRCGGGSYIDIQPDEVVIRHLQLFVGLWEIYEI
jgi:hypothetical protein